MTALIAALALVASPAAQQTPPAPAPTVDAATFAAVMQQTLEAHEAKHAEKDNSEWIRWAIVFGLTGLIGLVAWFGRSRLEGIESGQHQLGAKIEESTKTINEHTQKIGLIEMRTASLESFKAAREEEHRRNNEIHTEQLREQLENARKQLEDVREARKSSA